VIYIIQKKTISLKTWSFSFISLNTRDIIEQFYTHAYVFFCNIS